VKRPWNRRKDLPEEKLQPLAQMEINGENFLGFEQYEDEPEPEIP